MASAMCLEPREGRGRLAPLPRLSASVPEFWSPGSQLVAPFIWLPGHPGLRKWRETWWWGGRAGAGVRAGPAGRWRGSRPPGSSAGSPGQCGAAAGAPTGMARGPTATVAPGRIGACRPLRGQGTPRSPPVPAVGPRGSFVSLSPRPSPYSLPWRALSFHTAGALCSTGMTGSYQAASRRRWA